MHELLSHTGLVCYGGSLFATNSLHSSSEGY